MVHVLKICWNSTEKSKGQVIISCSEKGTQFYRKFYSGTLYAYIYIISSPEPKAPR